MVTIPKAYTEEFRNGVVALGSVEGVAEGAGVRDGRLHDARHTAATVPLVLGVPERSVMSIMG